MNACPYCGMPMPNQRRVQCGAPDCKRAFNRERSNAYQRNYAAEHGRSHTHRNDPVTHCGMCGTKIRGGSYCRACHQVRYAKRVAARNRARAKARAAARGTRSTWIWVQGTCTECGESFTRHGPATPICSKRCSRRAVGARRRARMAGVRVSKVRRHAIYERDGWTCHICGDPLDRTTVVPQPRAPVLDHVIPLAVGGPHHEDNLKAAHFLCNSTKRDCVA